MVASQLSLLGPDGNRGLPHVWSDTAGSADGIALYLSVLMTWPGQGIEPMASHLTGKNSAD